MRRLVRTAAADAIPGTNGEGIIGGDIGAGGRGVVFDDVARELSRSGISARGGVHDERGRVCAGLIVDCSERIVERDATSVLFRANFELCIYNM